MPYTYPNPPKLSIYSILEWMQQKGDDYIFKSSNLIDEFNISKYDAATRMARLRSMGFIRYYSVSYKRQGYVLTDYGKRFKKK